MFNADTDKEWEKFGRQDPYYGVLTFDKFGRALMGDAEREDFFASGQRHVDSIVTTIESHVLWNFTPVRALDFGCGVGRVLIPLAQVATHVTGVDISPSMLAEARLNCDATGVSNVELVSADDNLSRLEGQFDFIHSFIVFQHIPVTRGVRIFTRLLDLLGAGGVGVIHVTCGPRTARKRVLGFIKNYFPLAKNVFNLLRGRRFFAPQMQMNSYDLNTLMQIFHRAGVETIHSEFTNHGGEVGVILFFRKATTPG